jgi:hypothetical protein
MHRLYYMFRWCQSSFGAIHISHQCSLCCFSLFWGRKACF